MLYDFQFTKNPYKNGFQYFNHKTVSMVAKIDTILSFVNYQQRKEMSQMVSKDRLKMLPIG